MSPAPRLSARILHVRLLRLRLMGRTLIQSTLAAGVAWSLASLLPHHPRPYFAPIAAVICVSLSLAQHARRAVEIASGVAVGVLVGDALVQAIGVGGLQIAIGVGLAMSLAVLLGGSALVMNQAASSAVLITALPLPAGTAFYSRFLDALIGGAVGVVVTLVLPLRPFAVITRAATPVLAMMVTELRQVALALQTGSQEDAAAALERLRASEPALRELESAVAAGQEATRLAPARRRARLPVAALAQSATQVDRAMRNLRVLVRRCVRMLADGNDHAAATAPALEPLADAFTQLSAGLTSGAQRSIAREHALEAVRVIEAVPGAAHDLSFNVVVAQVRSIAVDVLRATGLGETEAIEQVRASASVNRDPHRGASPAP